MSSIEARSSCEFGHDQFQSFTQLGSDHGDSVNGPLRDTVTTSDRTNGKKCVKQTDYVTDEWVHINVLLTLYADLC